ncbi:hypothetical protein Pla175_51130 [Pirellulimonas nuda]|uniref:Uncharacterized protein n=1 Tax=Pirellulimonas nuda TaxID=2528009 RepID=A0A518DJN5_9BACT|nr:BBP7 family outer membrane beta-barrel protein [Pirellulimonas nuda]QDU91683.1 hypothetical protein Pla175_51130 [Pirellulimonas nuda]
MKLQSQATRGATFALAAMLAQMAAAQYPAYGPGAYSPAQRPQAPAQQPYPQPYYQQQATQPPAYPQVNYGPAPRVAYAAQNADLPTPQEQVPQPARPVNPAPAPAMGQQPGQPMPAPQGGYNSYPSAEAYSHPAAYSGSPAQGDCNCNQGAADWSGYTGAPAAGCTTGCSGYAGYPDSGCCDYGAGCYTPTPRRQWFVGAYGLLLQRSNIGDTKVATYVPNTPAAYPYYPNDSVTYLSSNAANPGIQGGGEIRFGSTFGCASACDCSGTRPFAWELGYWGIADQTETALMTDNFGGTTRMYGNINYAGIEYDRDGTGGANYAYRPVNHYYDYQMPIEDAMPYQPGVNDIRVLANRVRQSFNAQNVELNFWRFGTPSSAGCSPSAGYGACTAVSDCGGYDGCAPMSCNTCAPKRRFVCNGLLGVRYLKLDESFQNAVMFTVDDGAGGVMPAPVGTNPTAYVGGFPPDDNVLLHDIEVDNNMVGFQLGCSMNWMCGCHWSVFADTNFGVYNNHIEAYQRVYTDGGGMVRFVGTGGDAAVRSDKDQVAFLGELRTGVAYQLSCRWRATAAYRLIAVSGIATAQNQVPSNWMNHRHVGYIDSTDSLFLQGLQLGAECKF